MLKPPCNNIEDVVNPVSMTCLQGSPWMNTAAVPLLATGKRDFLNSATKLSNSDNFHPNLNLFPYYNAPNVTSRCDTTSSKHCTVAHLSVSHNAYSKFNETALGRNTELAATEIMAKMKSSSFIHLAAGDAHTNFYDLDGSRT